MYSTSFHACTDNILVAGFLPDIDVIQVEPSHVSKFSSPQNIPRVTWQTQGKSETLLIIIINISIFLQILKHDVLHVIPIDNDEDLRRVFILASVA